jgi:hypothetical protein
MLVRIPTNMMSATALADYVAAHMGLDVNLRMGVDGIKEKMKQAGFESEFIEIDDGRAEPEPIQRVEPKRERHTTTPLIKRMVHIRIEEQEKPGGSEPVFASVNGVHILIPRTQSCWVDFKYFHVLKNANQSIPITDEDNTIIGWRTVPEVPMSVFHIEPALTPEEKAENKRREAEIAAAREAEIAASEMVDAA